MSLALVLIFVLGVVSRLVLFPLRTAHKVIDSAEGVVDRTVDPDNVIYNYEWFKRTHQDVLAFDDQIKMAQESLDRFVAEAGPRKNWKMWDAIERDRLASVVFGLKNQRRSVVAEYNAKAKMVNRTIFRLGSPDALPTAME